MELIYARLLGLFFVLMFILGVAVLAAFITRRRGAVHIMFALSLVAMTFTSGQFFYDYITGVLESDAPRGWSFYVVEYLPVPTAVSVAVAVLIFYVVLVIDIHSYLFSNITPGSIKEGIDAMPDGILFYYDDGPIQMINPAMQNITEKICGKNITLGDELAKRLKEGTSFGGDCIYVKSGDKAIVQMPDGSVFSFEMRRKTFKNSEINEILSFDVTKEHVLMRELGEKNKELESQSLRLKTLNESITDMTIEAEMLKTKIRIHDELGNCLGVARHYLDTGAGDRKDVLTRFLNNISIFEEVDSRSVPTDLEMVLRAARDVGVAVTIEGDIPAVGVTNKIIASAIRECIVNTFKHAGGDAVIVKCVGDGDLVRVIISNNGNPPEKEIVERGGLLNLRNLVERNGGTMKIKSAPVFLLTITLNKRLGDILPDIYGI